MPDVCPWYMGYLLANPLRKLVQSPSAILTPHVGHGFRVLEPGPGMGFFTLELARLVGSAGKVYAVDLEPRMLSALDRRAERAGVAAQVETRVASPASLAVADLAGSIDFALAFAMVHELPDVEAFFAEMAQALKPGGRLLLAEPRGHVDDQAFAGELQAAGRHGLAVVDRPVIRWSTAALLEKG